MTLQSLNRSAYNFEEKFDHQKVIKSKSQSNIETYKNLWLIYSDINLINLQLPSYLQSLINIATSKPKPKKPLLFNNMSVSYILIKAIEIKPLNESEDWIE